MSYLKSIQTLHRNNIIDIVTKYGGSNIRIFGSIARGEDKPDSDLDILIDIEDGRSLFDIIAIQQDLEDILGRKVDVVTDGGLSPYLKEYILDEARPL